MKMTKTQYEIMNITMEECAEVIQALSKIFRFGIDGVNPVTGVSNINHLETELGDLRAMVDLLIRSHNLSSTNITKAYINKNQKLLQWSNINPNNIQSTDIPNRDTHPWFKERVNPNQG